jgi:hypothetical protein
VLTVLAALALVPVLPVPPLLELRLCPCDALDVEALELVAVTVAPGDIRNTPELESSGDVAGDCPAPELQPAAQATAIPLEAHANRVLVFIVALLQPARRRAVHILVRPPRRSASALIYGPRVAEVMCVEGCSLPSNSGTRACPRQSCETRTDDRPSYGELELKRETERERRYGRRSYFFASAASFSRYFFIISSCSCFGTMA